MYKNVHTSIIHYDSELETAHMLIKNRTHKHMVVYSGILHSNKNKHITIPCNHTDGSHKCNIEEKKPGTREFHGEVFLNGYAFALLVILFLNLDVGK